MHCIQDILQSNDNDDLLCKSTSTNASPFSSINSPNSTPSNQSLQIESNKHHQHITSNFFDAVKKWLNGKDKEKKEFGDIMRKIQNHSSFNEISVRARKLFGKRNDFYEQLMLLVSPSHNKSPVFINAVNDNVLLSNSVCLQLPTLNETMHTSNIDINDTDQNTFETAANRKQQNLKSDSMLNLVHQSPNKPNEKKRKRDELLTHNNFNSNGQTHNPSKKRKTSNHSIQGSSNIPTNNSYKYNKNKSNGNTNLDNHIWSTIDNNYTNTLLPSTSNISTSTNSSIANDNNHNSNNRIPYKKHRKSKHKKNNTNKHNNNNNSNNKNNNNKAKDMHSDDAVLNELMDGIEEDMGLPIHILATIKQELIKENPRNFQLFLQGMALCSIGIIKPDQFVNMMSPLFVGNKKLKLVLHQLRTILHVPLHYFHSTPLYAPFLSDLTTSDKNMNLSLRSNAEQYSHIVDFQNNCTKIRMNPTRSPCKNPQRRSLSPYKKNTTSSSSLSTKSMSISAKYNAVINNSNCISYRQNPHYKKNLICSNKQPFHLQIVNDEYVSRSTGAENNPENDHMTNRNKHEIELNEKEHILTLWDYYVEQNKHAIQCLRRLESRILYLYKQYKKIFIIRDDYDSSDNNNNDDKSSIVDESNIHFYDSDTYTTATEDLRGSDSDVSIDDNHSTNSEPLTHLVSRTFPRKSVSTGGAVHSIPEHKSMMDINNDSDATVMTTRSDMTHGRYHIKPKVNKKISNNNNNNNNIKKRIRKKRNIQKTETDKKYVLSRIYADIDMNEYMTPIAWSAVHRLYAEHFQNVKMALYNNPLSAINIVLPRLEMKHKEWENNRQMAQGIYRDVAQRNCMKALDWQPKYKRLDKTRLSHNELWRELIAAQSLLNPKYITIIENERQKRSGLKEQQREQFNKQYSPMDGASTIKPTKLIQEHFAAKVGSNCTREIERRLEGKRMMVQWSEQDQKQDGDGDSEMDLDGGSEEHKTMNHKFDFRMNIYYNYGLRFDLRDSNFDSVINLPLTSHEHCWNVVVQYLSTEYQHKKMKDVILEDVVKFYSNFIFLLFEIDLFHEELFPSKVFNKLSFEYAEDQMDDNDSIKFDDLCKMKMIGVNIEELKYKPLVYDLEYFGEDIDMNGCDDNMISYHNRMSNVILVNRNIYNIMRLYIHLFQRLQKARDLSTNRWRLNFDPGKKEENEILQEKNEREFYGKLLALIQGQIKETEFDLIIQQLFGPEGYECSNIKYLIKSLCVSIQNVLMNGKNKKRYVSGDGKVWDIIKLWHFYYPIWKQIDVNNVKQRIGMLRRYYSDIGNVLSSKDNVVLIEYFLDSKEIGVQFLGDNDQNKCDNDFVQSNMISRWWQMPVKHSTGWKYVQNMPFLRKKQEKLEKYRIKKQNKSNNHNNNNKKSSSYKRINTMMDNMTMNIFEGYSKRGKNKNKNRHKNKNKRERGKKKKNDDLFFIMRSGQPISMNYNNHNEYTSDDSNISKSKRKRKRKSKTNGHLNNNNINMNGNHTDISECEDYNDKNLSIWYHPNSRLYFQSINLSKISKRNKPLHKNRISVNKYDKKLKKFNLWHEKRFKEIQRSKQHINHNNNNNNNNSVRSNDKYNTFSPQLNGGNHSKNNSNNNNNIFTISNDHNNNNNNNNNLLLNNSHNNSPYSTHNNNNNNNNNNSNNNPLVVSSALNNIIPSSSNVNSLLSTNNPSTNQQSIQQLINTNQSLSLNTNNNINNLLINNISTPTNTSQQTQLYTTSTNGQNNTSSGTIYAALNTNNNMLAATQQQAQQYYAYRTTTGNNSTQLITTAGNTSQNTTTNGQISSNNTPTQYAVATTQYPSAYATYGQYTVGTTPTGYVAIQQQGVSPHTANASYVMDNRTGSIYAAIPATGHYTTSNGMGVYAVPTTSQTHPSQTQYVSIPTTQMTQGIQQHMLTQSSVNNGQSTAVVLTNPNTNNTQQTQNTNVNNTPQTNNSNNSQNNNSNNTMSTPPNIGVQDKINDANNSNNSMQLPVLNASSVRNSSNDTNNNNKSDVK